MLLKESIAAGNLAWRRRPAHDTQIDLDQPKAYAYAREVMSMNSMTSDAQEGISAFLGKRAACWAGK